MKLFKKSFLFNLQKKCGAETVVNHYIDDLGMSFHDAIVKFANFHSVPIEYYDPEEHEKLEPHETGSYILSAICKEYDIENPLDKVGLNNG